MKTLKISIGIFLALAVSRFIPHPPNFTNLIALSFYVPALLGRKFIPAIIVSFAVTDLIIGYHSLTHWTWGSVLIIGLIVEFFKNKTSLRILGSVFAVFIFYIITNFGVWTLGSYGYNPEGLITSYIMAIPFLGYNLISTFLYALLIEAVIYYFNFKKLNKNYRI